jgi:hypothetical protein
MTRAVGVATSDARSCRIAEGGAEPAGDTDYERSSTGYDRQRRADPRIAAHVQDALGDARTVINVGAGAGSYEPSDRYVLAIEPSSAMRARRGALGATPAIDASAEALPLDADAVDAAMAIFTVHQWRDLRRGLRELRRVSSGPIVILTIDSDALSDYWLGEYLPARLVIARRRFPPVDAVCDLLGGMSTVSRVPIPLDCTDGFVEAFYGRPEALLDPAVRDAQSGWQFLEPSDTEAGLSRLAFDLQSGTWDSSWGHLRRQPTYLGPLTLITSRS